MWEVHGKMDGRGISIVRWIGVQCPPLRWMGTWESIVRWTGMGVSKVRWIGDMRGP